HRRRHHLCGSDDRRRYLHPGGLVLRRRRLPVATLLAAGLAACGGEEVVVPVTLNLDSASCGTNTATQVSLSCDSAVGAWVKRGDPADPDISEDACVDFASDGESLAALPALLSDSVDLSGISSGDVWL